LEKRGEVDLSNSIKLTLKKHTQRQKQDASIVENDAKLFAAPKPSDTQKMTRTKSVIFFWK